MLYSEGNLLIKTVLYYHLRVESKNLKSMYVTLKQTQRHRETSADQWGQGRGQVGGTNYLV